MEMENKTQVVALALGYPQRTHNISDALLAEGVIRWGRRAGWDLIDLGAWRWKIPSEMKVEGLIYNPGLSSREMLESLVGEIPFKVRIDPPEKAEHKRDVETDWEAVGQQAAEYYLDRGFRNFALAAYRTSEWIQSLRVFKERIEQAGGRCEVIRNMHMGGTNLEKVRKSVSRQLRELTYPLGIFCADDQLAVRLCRWCLENGIAVPEQAAILGYGNHAVACNLSPVALSSIDPHLEQHGYEAARLLQRMMDGETIPGGTLVRVPPNGIVTRRSTDITAIPDAQAARALRYIWDHYAWSIYPDEIASSCGMSRRNLDRHFKQALGRTAAQEITRQRLRRARELLASGEMDAADIAERVGFSTPQYFNFRFKQHFGLTPQRYRENKRKKH
ncbi:MAG: substrate-binding domain-containing protein [Lentisphaeria bacterium]